MNVTPQIMKMYMDAGYSCPIPLPEGEKKPPPNNTTGRVPVVTRQLLAEVWDNPPAGDFNLGLRLQGYDQDIISLDVDHYDEKQGFTELKEKERLLGSLHLDKMVRSSRRGADNPSGQYFFRVPRGQRWVSRLCNGVDIVQMTYRYSVVWPSVVDGQQYKWLAPDGSEAEIPKVADLPELPAKWVARLKVGALHELADRAPGVVAGYQQADEWLAEHSHGWTKPLGPAFEELNFEVAGHDTMLPVARQIVLRSFDGFGGGRAALERLVAAYRAEFASRDRPRLSARGAEAEVHAAFVWALNTAISDGVELREARDITIDPAAFAKFAATFNRKDNS